MKKAVLAISLILCLSLVSFLEDYKTSLVKANSNTIHVPTDFPTIQEAINNASSGDTILVQKGKTYYENVVINKSISLIGEEKETTIIDGSGRESVIFIKGVDNVVVKCFTIRGSGTFLYNSSGVLIERSSGDIISDNIILNNYNGISLYCSFNSIIKNNIISSNRFGISLSNSGNIIICGNKISESFFSGITLYSSSNNLIKNNVVSSNEYGIELYWSQNNMFSANTILDNSCGIDIFTSSDNIIYHNNFDNIVQVSSVDSANFWSYCGEGNYWSNYTGQDLYGGPYQNETGSDGIGDVPYVIDWDDQADSSPLMGMFSEFDFTYKGEAYQFAIISNSTISDFHSQIGNETGNKILQFNVGGGADTFGFCRIMIPTRFMNYPYIVLVGGEDVNPVFLDVSNETHVYLYLTYPHENQTVAIISFELYGELLDSYQRLQEYLYHLNMTYAELQANFYGLNATYHNLFDNFTRLQEAYQELNSSYNELLLNYSESVSGLFDNFTRLQEAYQELNSSYNELLSKHSESVNNIQNLTYIFAATTAILIIATAYLSKRAHTGVTSKIKRLGEG
jgi:parallel beta-helix repeat protein